MGEKRGRGERGLRSDTTMKQRALQRGTKAAGVPAGPPRLASLARSLAHSLVEAVAARAERHRRVADRAGGRVHEDGEEAVGRPLQRQRPHGALARLVEANVARRGGEGAELKLRSFVWRCGGGCGAVRGG